MKLHSTIPPDLTKISFPIRTRGHQEEHELGGQSSFSEERK